MASYHPSFARAENMAKCIIRRTQETVMLNEDHVDEAEYK
jgi:hypothetical protein